MSIIRILSNWPQGHIFYKRRFLYGIKDTGHLLQRNPFWCREQQTQKCKLRWRLQWKLKRYRPSRWRHGYRRCHQESRRRKLQRPPNLMSRPACKSFKAVQRAAGLNIKSESFPDVKIAPQEVCCARGYFFYSVHKLSNHYSHRPRPVLSTVSSHQPSPFISLCLYYPAGIIY